MTSTENAKKIMTSIVELFSTEKLPDVAAKAYISAPQIPSSSWSLGNRLAMVIAGTSDARGYKQWGDVGRNVKKGSKAIYILGPRMVKSSERDQNGEPKKILVGFRALPVFAIEDTEGRELEEYEPRKLPPLFDLSKHNGIDVTYANSSHGEYGYINVDQKRMVLCTESADTYLHELMHFYDLKNRSDKVGGQDKTQEIVAQLGACILARMYGVDEDDLVTKYTWKYISGYSHAESPELIAKECIAVLGRVESAINSILADAEKLGPATVPNVS